MILTLEGHIIIKSGEPWPVNMKSYKPHETIPLTMVPNFPDECLARRFIGKITACHKPIFQWWCLLKGNVAIRDCKGCTINEEERTRAYTQSLDRRYDCNNCGQHESGQSPNPIGTTAVS